MKRVVLLAFIIISSIGCNQTVEINSDSHISSMTPNANSVESKHQDITTELDVFVLNGTYIIEDFFSGKSTTVEFREDGTIKNFYDYTRYKTFRDLWGTGRKMDRISLIKNDSTIDNFALKFTKNSLEFYTVTCVTFDSIDSICREGSFDRKVYKLNKNPQ